MTAWRMEAPQLFGSFHIAASSLTVLAAVFAAVVVSFTLRKRSLPGTCCTDEECRDRDAIRYGADEDADSGVCRCPNEGCTGRAGSDISSYTIQDSMGSAGCCRKNEVQLMRILSACGWFLAALEIYKQLFLYFIVCDRIYDWWYFPFQLCSVPMYLCILLPFAGERLRSIFLTFMSGYTFVSAAAALLFPEDFLRSYITLTLHGFIWHGLLLFISLTIFFTGASDATAHSLLKAGGLFAVLCILAVLINIAAEPLMQSAYASHSGFPHEYAAMFYMNPYHISPQPLVSSVQRSIGIPAGLALYAAAIAAAGSFVSGITKFFYSRSPI